MESIPDLYEDLSIDANSKLDIIKFLVYNYPTTLDYPDGETAAGGNNWVSNKDHYLDTYISIVNETSCSSKFTFVSEKTIRPMFNRHPFIVWGNPFTLKYLRSLGFKTFGWLLDESYDEVIDTNKRVDMIISEINRINNLPIEVLHRLYYDNMDTMEHNYKVLRWIKTPLRTQILKNIL